MDSIYFSPLPRPLQAFNKEMVQSPLHVAMATMNLQTPATEEEVDLCLDIEDQGVLVMLCMNAIAGPTELVHSRDVNLCMFADMI